MHSPKTKTSLSESSPLAATVDSIDALNANPPPLLSRQAAFALLWLFVFSFLMFTTPFASFYLTKHLLLEHFGVDGFANTAWSVFMAVLTVNLIIVVYAMKGYYEKDEDESPTVDSISGQPETVVANEKPKHSKKKKAQKAD
jgi:hypothetical protein